MDFSLPNTNTDLPLAELVFNPLPMISKYYYYKKNNILIHTLEKKTIPSETQGSQQYESDDEGESENNNDETETVPAPTPTLNNNNNTTTSTINNNNEIIDHTFDYTVDTPWEQQRHQYIALIASSVIKVMQKHNGAYLKDTSELNVLNALPQALTNRAGEIVFLIM